MQNGPDWLGHTRATAWPSAATLDHTTLNANLPPPVNQNTTYLAMPSTRRSNSLFTLFRLSLLIVICVLATACGSEPALEISDIEVIRDEGERFRSAKVSFKTLREVSVASATKEIRKLSKDYCADVGPDSIPGLPFLDERKASNVADFQLPAGSTTVQELSCRGLMLAEVPLPRLLEKDERTWSVEADMQALAKAIGWRGMHDAMQSDGRNLLTRYTVFAIAANRAEREEAIQKTIGLRAAQWTASCAGKEVTLRIIATASRRSPEQIQPPEWVEGQRRLYPWAFPTAKDLHWVYAAIESECKVSLLSHDQYIREAQLEKFQNDEIRVGKMKAYDEENPAHTY